MFAEAGLGGLSFGINKNLSRVKLGKQALNDFAEIPIFSPNYDSVEVRFLHSTEKFDYQDPDVPGIGKKHPLELLWQKDMYWQIIHYGEPLEWRTLVYVRFRWVTATDDPRVDFNCAKGAIAPFYNLVLNSESFSFLSTHIHKTFRKQSTNENL